MSSSRPTQKRDRRVSMEISGLPAPLRLACTTGSGLSCLVRVLVLVLAPALDLLMHFVFFGTSTNCFHLVSDLPPATAFKPSVVPVALTHASSLPSPRNLPSANSLWPGWTLAATSAGAPALPSLVTVLHVQHSLSKAQLRGSSCHLHLRHEASGTWVTNEVCTG